MKNGGTNTKKYAEAMERRDWQTCDLICEEHEYLQKEIDSLSKLIKQCGCGDIVGQCACLERELKERDERIKELENEIENYEINILKVMKNRDIAVEALKWIATTDTSRDPPDFLWLCRWRNTRKEAAAKALKQIGEIK